MKSNRKQSPVVTDLFLRERNLNISIAFISQSFFKVSKTIRLNDVLLLLIYFKRKKTQYFACFYVTILPFIQMQHIVLL